MKFHLYLSLITWSNGMIFGETNWITSVRTKLLENYNPNVRPVLDHKSNTTIHLSLSLNNLNLEDHDQQMTAVTFLLVTWNDEFLKWDPVQNGGISSLHFGIDEIWRPDITLYNSATSESTALNSDLPVLCYNNGKVLWVPPFRAKVPCQIDISNWPSDAHTCTLRVGSWAHGGEQLDLQLVKDQPISVSYYETNKRWSLVNYTADRKTTKYDNETYFHIDFKFTLKREAAAHATYVTQTAFAVMLIVLGSYLLPLCYHLSRFLLHLFGISILVAGNFVLFVTLPATGGSIPHVVKYYSGTVILTTLSLLCNVVMATSLSSEISFHGDVKKKLASFFKPKPTNTSRQMQSDEIGYATLSEELAEFPPTANSTNTHEPQLESKEVPSNTIGIHRLLNCVLFFMYSLAFVIDYSVMKYEIAA